MPFDASGNFTRIYNFQQDRDNGIKILAARVDGEFDNVATGMNAVFFRDGRVPMQADLRMNINGITGLKDGALGSPAIKFNTDANTGVYLDGISRYGIQVNSVQRGVFTTAGFDVTGALTATGNISMGGNLVATQAFVAGVYAPLASPPFTGVPTAPTAATGTNTTQLATTAFVQGGYYPVTGGTLNGSMSVLGGSIILGSNSVTGSGLYLNSATGNLRTLGFQTAGVYAGDIALQTNNVDFKYNSNGGAHIFTVTGTEYARVNNSGLQTPVLGVTGTGGAIQVQPRDLSNTLGGSPLIYSPSTKAMNINDGQGSDVIRFDVNGIATLVKAGSGFVCNGAQGSYTVGFSNSRTGQVGYHMYNGGGVSEWVVYQPAAATGHEFRIGAAGSGSITDRWKIDNSGNVFTLGHQSVGGEMWVGGASGIGTIRFGNGSGSTKYLYYDGTNFNLSASLVVGGNISSSSDARLKSNVRELNNGLALVNALQPKRFTMYGKPDFGFIAQEAMGAVPEVVSVDSNGYMSIDYGRLTAVLASAVQSLDERLYAVERLLAI